MRENFDRAGMVDGESGLLKGYIPDDLDIWIPPKSENIDGLELSNVVIGGTDEAAHIVFFVPKDWVNKNIKSGWKTRLQEIGWTKKEDTSRLLDQFILLANAKPDRFLDFAKKWGPLWKQSSFKGMIPDNYNLAPWIESVEVWRLYARDVKLTLEIASFLHQNKPAPLETWKLLFHHNVDKRRFDTIEKQRNELKNHINSKMVFDYGVKFYIDWYSMEPELIISSKLGFINSVWFQLLQAITKRTICLCYGCGRVYARTGRRPAKGRNNYCKICGVSTSKRDYVRRKSEERN